MKKLIVTLGLASILVLGSQMPAKAGWAVFVAPVPLPVPAAPPPYYPLVAVYRFGPGFYPAGHYWDLQVTITTHILTGATHTGAMAIVA